MTPGGLMRKSEFSEHQIITLLKAEEAINGKPSTGGMEALIFGSPRSWKERSGA